MNGSESHKSLGHIRNLILYEVENSTKGGIQIIYSSMVLNPVDES
jgi:hypothetical protein